MSASERFAAWWREQREAGYAPGSIARRLGVTRQTVSNWRKGGVSPAPAARLAIERETGGCIDASMWRPAGAAVEYRPPERPHLQRLAHLKLRRWLAENPGIAKADFARRIGVTRQLLSHILRRNSVPRDSVRERIRLATDGAVGVDAWRMDPTGMRM